MQPSLALAPALAAKICFYWKGCSEQPRAGVGGQAFNCLGDVATERERVQLQGSIVAAVPCRSFLPSWESKWGIVVPWGSREAKLVFELPVCQAARHSLGLIITHLQKGIWHSDGRMAVVGHAASEQQS